MPWPWLRQLFISRYSPLLEKELSESRYMRRLAQLVLYNWTKIKEVGNGVAKGVPEQQVHSSSEQYRIDTTLMGRVMYRFVRNIKEEVKRLMK